MELQAYSGAYYFMGVLIEIFVEAGHLWARMPGVPPGYEIAMEPLGEGRFRMHGGPLDHSTVRFLPGEGGAFALQAGAFELARVETVDRLAVTERLLAPSFELTIEKRTAFARVLDSVLASRDGGWIDYQLPHPIHEFVQYVTDQGIIIFHGSNNPEIERFEPVRKSMELRDETGRGNLQAVYGTHDALWAMFFAVVDRARLRGSIRNGVMYFHDRDGNSLSVYNFSINQEQLAERPYTEGVLYFLPRETFARLKLTEEAYANEWASEQVVEPLAKLRVRPEDFPFIRQIGGHDDGELLRLEELGKSIRENARAATLNEDQFTVELPAYPGFLAELEEYIALQRTYLPAARFELERRDSGIQLTVTSLPPAVRQMLKESYSELLDGDS